MPTKDQLERVRRARFWMALDAFAMSLEPKISRAFLTAVDTLRDSLTAEELAQFVATQDYTALLAKLDMRGVQLALRDAVDAAAAHTLELPQLAGIARVRFDVMHPYVIEAMRTYESKAIAVLTNTIQAGVVQYLERTVPYGTNPIVIAQGLRDVIGLPDNLVTAGVNYRRFLVEGDKAALSRAIRDKRFDDTIRRAIAQGKGLPPDKVEQQMARWYARAQRMNAETITRTAAMDAVNMGNRLGWQQMIADGYVQERLLRRWWVVARDERTCERCKPIPALNPAGRAWNELFVTPEDGLVMWPTLHFRCRCVLWTEQVED